MLRRAATVVASLAALLALAPRPLAHADPPAPGEQVRLSWVRAEGAETCPAAPAIAREVVRLLGRDPFGAEAPRAIEVLAARASAGGAWTARIFVRQPDGALAGTREIRNDDAPDCEPLAASVALAVALAIDPEATLAAPSRAPAVTTIAATRAAAGTTSAPGAASATRVTTAAGTTLATPPRPAPPPPPPPPPPPRAPPVAPPRTVVTARALLAVGLLPVVAPGVALAARGTVYDRLGWSADLLLLPEQRTSDQGFAFGLTAGRLAACVDALRAARLALEGCAGAALGDLHAVVYSPIPTAPGDRVWVALSAGARFTVAVVGPLALEAGVDLVVPLTRQAFAIATRPLDPPVFQQSPVAGLGYLGAGLRF